MLNTPRIFEEFIYFIFHFSKVIKNAFVNVVSEVAMESSPGPSTSSGSRAETDSRTQSNAASTPRAGTICTLICKSMGFLHSGTS